MKLHLGCGTKIIPNYINIDARDNPGVDVVAKINKLSQYKDNSVDLIYACHVLEHFGRWEYKDVLSEWTRVLKPGGYIRLAVPDFDKIARMYIDGYKLSELMGLLYGGQNYPGNTHYTTFTFESLKLDLEGLGYHNIGIWDWKTTEHSNIDAFSQAYLPHMDKINGQLMSLNVGGYKI